MPAQPSQLILTQDADGAADWQALLTAHGLPSWHWPAFAIHPLSDETVLARFTDGMQPLADDPLSRVRIVVLPSPAAVRVLAGALGRQRLGWPAGVWAGVPGAGTAQVFRQQLGEPARLLCPPPPAQDAAHLALEILAALRADDRGGPVSSARLVLLNRPDGRTDWLEALRAQGIEVHVRPVYQVRACRAMPADLGTKLAAWQAEGRRLHWVVGAAAPLQTVAGWLAALPDPLRLWAGAQPLWVPHPRLLAQARGLGFARAHFYHHRQQLIEQLQSGQV